MAEQAPIREIYWAYHWYDEDERTLKTIGHFSSEAKAKAAVEVASMKQPLEILQDERVPELIAA